MPLSAIPLIFFCSKTLYNKTFTSLCTCVMPSIQNTVNDNCSKYVCFNKFHSWYHFLSETNLSKLEQLFPYENLLNQERCCQFLEVAIVVSLLQFYRHPRRTITVHKEYFSAARRRNFSCK